MGYKGNGTCSGSRGPQVKVPPRPAAPDPKSPAVRRAQRHIRRSSPRWSRPEPHALGELPRTPKKASAHVPCLKYALCASGRLRGESGRRAPGSRRWLRSGAPVSTFPGQRATSGDERDGCARRPGLRRARRAARGERSRVQATATPSGRAARGRRRPAPAAPRPAPAAPRAQDVPEPAEGEAGRRLPPLSGSPALGASPPAGPALCASGLEPRGR